VTDEQSEPIRVLLVDDEALLRAGVRMVLSRAPDIEVVAEAGRRRRRRGSRPASPRRYRPRGYPHAGHGRARGGRTPDHARAIRQNRGIDHLGEDDYVTRALTAGAAGFVFKDTGPRDLIHAVRVAAAGDAILSPRITRRLIEQHVTANASRGALARRLVGLLTERERDVLVLIGLGMPNGEAGRRLSLGEGTVKTHVKHILAKLRCANRVQAAILAHEADLLSET
jgi:DNA-binding NarL/FixJ family response regulator